MQSAMDFHGLGAKYPGSGGGLDEAAQAAGYRALGNGNYINQSRWWEAPISGQELQGKLDAQGFSKQQSNPANLIGGTDYLAQIQQYLNPLSGVGNNDFLGQIQQYMGSPGGGNENTDYAGQIQQYLDQQQNGDLGGAASGTQAQNPYEKRLQELVNNPNSISDSNAYKFRFNQGQQALERGAAAKGMLGSGNTLAALAQYGQGMASDEYGNEVSRLGALSGQRDSYNLGLKGLANSEYGLRAGVEQSRNAAAQNRGALALSALTAGGDQRLRAGALDQSRGALALSALSTANDQRLKANQLASSTATATGLVRPNIW